jgi:uncharacterized repeat protein (TIGR03803 family)
VLTSVYDNCLVWLLSHEVAFTVECSILSGQRFLPPGCGVVFKLTPTAHGLWEETVLYTFTGGADGNEPWSIPTLDSSGNLYGTTSIGGNLSCGPYSCGVVFKLSPGDGGPWTESVLYTFNNSTDGGFSLSGVTFDYRGNLYGTTLYGGDLSVSCFGNPGCGVVYKLARTPSGRWSETVLHAGLVTTITLE